MIADALLHWLLRTSLEASLLILAVLGLRLMLGARLSPAWRIGLWLLVGMKLMLPAFIPAGFGLGAWFQQEEAARFSEASVTPFVSSADTVMTVNSGMPQMVSEASSGVSGTAGLISGYQLAAGLWLAGTLIVFAAALYRQRRFNLNLSQRPAGTAPVLRALVASLCQKAGIQRSVRIVLMPAGTTPAVVGIAKPSVLLPEDWETCFDERTLRHVLLHELLHVKQHDLIWSWAATAVQALHWFNPLVWFVVSRFQADRELRCDAGALALLSPTERLDYGHTLLRIQETFYAPPAMAGLAPCVRNHPTLRQRIHMIAHPTARQPVIQMLLVLTLSILVCYSFTTVRAAEKEVPAKVRSRDGARAPEAEKTKTGAASEDGPPAKTREGDGGTKKPGMRDGDGGTKKPGMGDGEDGKKKPGMRDGEGGTKKPSTGDGEGGKKTGARDGEGDTKKPGVRDGDGGTKKPGMRDGDGGKKTNVRDGDGDTKKTGARDGEGGKKSGTRDGDKAAASGETITFRVNESGESVMVGEEEVSMNRLRGYLSSFLPDHPGAKITVTADPKTKYQHLLDVLDAIRDNGNKNAGIKSE